MHWYDAKTGEPRYEIPYANGRPGMREPRLDDAKKLGLAPGVTSVQRIITNEGLNEYYVNQAILAALTHPGLRPDMTHDEMISAIKRDAREHARKAAQRGSEIHDAIEKCMAGRSFPDKYVEHVNGAVMCLKIKCGQQDWIAEAHLPGGLGYGGRVDLHSDEWIVDFKTKEFTQADLDAGRIKGWPEQHVQLVAYAIGLSGGANWLTGAVANVRRLANLFVSTSEPGLCLFWEWPREDFWSALAQWQATLNAWYAYKDPEGRMRA